MSNSFLELCLWAIPYGLGAGGVDASLNNYVALHYTSRHMSWLHCMWGIGASAGPYILSFVFQGGGFWNDGFLTMKFTDSQMIRLGQMASAYMGSLLMSALFGIIANHIHIAWLSIYLLAILGVMVTMYGQLMKGK